VELSYSVAAISASSCRCHKLDYTTSIGLFKVCFVCSSITTVL